MDKQNNIFSEEYDIESGTDASIKSTDKKLPEQTVAQKVRYGESKPVRVIIKAKVAHDAG